VSEKRILKVQYSCHWQPCVIYKKMATGILMLNLGGPKTPADVGKFLHRLFSDRTFVQIPFGLGKLIARFRTAGVTKQYEEIGGSPLLHWTNR
jgi:ferrochelatase